MTMKRILSYLTIPALFLAAAACAPKEEIKFAHEEQAFDTRSDRILVEAILPQATAADDEVYIIGAFNGGEGNWKPALYSDLAALTRYSGSTQTRAWNAYDQGAFTANGSPSAILDCFGE